MGEKIKTYAAMTVVALGGLLLGFLFFKYVFGVLVPFGIGWVVALAVRRPGEVLGRRLPLPQGVLRLILAGIVTAVIGVALFFGGKGLLTEASALLGRLESGEIRIGAAAMEFINRFPFAARLFPNPDALFLRLGEWLMSVLPPLISRLASSLPSIFLGGIFALIATVYFCLDLERIHGGLRRVLPTRLRSVAELLKSRAVRVGITVLRTEFLLMLIAFGLVFLGFLLLGIRYPLLLSAVFSLFDLLPAVGVGTLLIPWGIWLLITGEIGKGVGILLLAVVVAVVRQFIEPRLLGARYELHPLLTLLAMYAGARLFGGWGLLLAPMLLLLLRATLFEEAEEKKEPPKQARAAR